MPTKKHDGHAILNDRNGSPVYFKDNEAQEDPSINKYLKSKKFTPEEYVDLMSGKYGHGYLHLDALLERLGKENHPHYKEENHDKILDNLASKLRDPSSNLRADDADEYQNVIQEILKHPLSKEKIHEYIKNPDKYGFYESEKNYKTKGDHLGALRNQPNLDKEHFRANIDNPDLVELAGHPEFDKNTLDAWFDGAVKNNTLTKLPPRNIDAVGSYDLSEDQVERLINLPKSRQSLNRLLNHFKPEESRQAEMLEGEKLAPNERKKAIVDRILGISGGSHEDDDKAADPDNNYQNWSHGPEYNSDKAEELAEGKHLTDDQIEHIKRHGTFDQIYNLYNNEDIDPKHGKDIWEKWYNDDSHHGYDVDELKKKLKEEHEDSAYDNFGEQAREEVEENYTLDDYIRDANVDLNGMDDYETLDKLVKEKLGEEDWKGENPDYDPDKPESEDNPKEIDFSDHPYHKIEDHPDFEEKEQGLKEDSDVIEEAEEKIKRHNLPDKIYDGYSEATSDDAYTRAQDLFEEDIDKNALDTDYVPRHLHAHIPKIEELQRRNREQREKEAKVKALAEQKNLSEFLDTQAKVRPEKQDYAMGQHHLEMLKDHADARGGAVDVGSMNKAYPNLKDKWKSAFEGKGKLSSQEIQDKIDKLPKTKFDISFGKWDPAVGMGSVQNTNQRKEMVIRLDHSPDSLKPLKESPETEKVFNAVAEASQRSGHPTNANTIGWIRLDANDPKHWFIDELQSDFEAGGREYLEQHGAEEQAKSLDSVIKYHEPWREALMNYAVKFAKANGVEKISTHSDESKSAHTGSDKIHSCYRKSYHQVPRSLGFAPADAKDLPLTEEGKEVFSSGKSKVDPSEKLGKHSQAMNDHNYMAVASKDLAEKAKNPNLGLYKEGGIWEGKTPEEVTKHYSKMVDHHMGLARRHQKEIKQIDPEIEEGRKALSSGVEIEEHLKPDYMKDALKSLSENKPFAHAHDALLEEEKEGKELKGHTLVLSPAALKKALEILDDLSKNDETIDLDWVFERFEKIDKLRIKLDLLKSMSK